MAELSDPPGIVALAAAGVALVSLVLAGVLWFRLSRVRADQRAVLGGTAAQDLVTHSARLQDAFVDLQDRVDEVAAALDVRMTEAERRLDGAIAYHALVRYDAYGELTGNQSTTIALLDSERNGVILSAIVRRESARLYCKLLVDGEGELELSPEELEAVRLALAGETGSRVLS